MSDFSTLLSEYIHSKYINTYSLAQYCGLDRSNMYKIISGKRNLPSAEILDKISRFLHLSQIEREELEEAYTISLVGHDTYFRRKAVLNFFNNISLSRQNIPEGKYEITSHFDFQDSTFSTGRTEIDCALLHIITAESNTEHPTFSLMIPPEFHFVRDLLIALGHTNKKMKIRHILCLNNNNDVPDSLKNHNLNCLKNIFPMYSCDFQYESYYYYDNILSKSSRLALFPFMIITSRHACLLSSNLEKGIFFERLNIVRQLQNTFDQYQRSCSLFLKQYSDPFTLLDYVSSPAQDHSAGFSFQMTPCLTPFLNKAILEKYIFKDIPDREVFIHTLLEQCSSVRRSLHSNSVNFIFSLDGIRSFMNTGRVNEYPSELYIPFEKEDRVYLLRQLYTACKTHPFRMMKHNIGDINNEIFLHITHKTGYILFYTYTRKNIVYLNIEESGLLLTFWDFCENLDPNLFYPKKTALDLIEQILEDYK